MLFDRCPTENRKRSLHTKSVQYKSVIPLSDIIWREIGYYAVLSVCL